MEFFGKSQIYSMDGMMLVRFLVDRYVSSGRMKTKLDENLCLVEINDIHGFQGGLRGFPVFDPCGRVVGICSFYMG